MAQALSEDEAALVAKLEKGLKAFDRNDSYRRGFIQRRLKMLRFRKCLYEGEELKPDLNEKLLASPYKIEIVEFHQQIYLYSMSKFSDEDITNIVKDTNMPLQYLVFRTMKASEFDKLPKLEYKHLAG